MQCNPICGGFVYYHGAVKERLVGTHLKAPFQFRLIKKQEQNNDLFFIEIF
jgi:hypothetical protein